MSMEKIPEEVMGDERIPIHKFNGGKGATLCHTCRAIITTGLSERLLCDSCENYQRKTHEQ